MKDIIKDFICEHPEVESFKEGFPNIGKREDSLPFGAAVHSIEEAWHFYDVDLYGLDTEQSIIKFGSGNPYCYRPFPLSTKYLKKVLNKRLYEYPAAAGEEDHREILAQYLMKEGFPNIHYSNVLITNSTTHGFYLILKAIFRPYDVILMTGPNYGLFAFMPERLNIGVEIIDLKRENDYILDYHEMDQKIKEINKQLKNKYKGRLDYVPRVRGFLNINPHNPLGTVLSDQNIDILQGIGEVCKKHNVFVIDDLVYRDLSYNRNHLAKPIGSIDEYFDYSISLFGLSKSYGLAKTRTGFIVANEVIIRALRDQLFYMMDSASILQSSLLVGAYNPCYYRDVVYKKYFKDIIEKYRYNCYLCIAMIDGIESIKDTKYYSSIKRFLKRKIHNSEELQNIYEGIPYAHVEIIPKSGFFLLINFTQFKKTGMISSEQELLAYFYKKCGIKFLVGQSFSWPYKDEIIMRITYSFDKDILVDAFHRIHLCMRGDICETDRDNSKS